MVNFPTSLDELTNPTGADTQDSPDHAAQHANANDIVEALEAKVGIDSSAVTTSIDYKINNLTGQNLLENASFESYNIDTDLPVWWDLNSTPTLAIAADTLFPARKGNQVTITAVGANFEGIRITGSATNYLTCLPNTTYIFALDYKVTAGDFLNVLVRDYNGAAFISALVDDSTLNSTDAVRPTFTFTTTANATNLEILVLAKTDGDIVIVSHPKLEQGAIATPYIPPDRNKSIVTTIASHATPTPVIVAKKTIYNITAQAAALAPGAPTGLKYDGDELIYRMEDNGTGRAITWNAIFEAVVALRATTVASKKNYETFRYNADDSKWDCVDSILEP